MTHPYYHARSSVAVWGGCEEDYLPVHHWIDASKERYADFRHRALRHHSQGLFEAERALGVVITNADGKQVPVRYIGEQHVLEDCAQRIPSIDDWLERLIEGPWLDESKLTALDHTGSLSKTFGGRPDEYMGLVRWFDEHRAHTSRPGFRLFRHHTEGIAEAEALFGPVLCLRNGQEVATGAVAEAHVRRSGDGSLCSQVVWLRRLRRAPWMARASKIRTMGHLTRRGE